MFWALQDRGSSSPSDGVDDLNIPAIGSIMALNKVGRQNPTESKVTQTYFSFGTNKPQKVTFFDKLNI